ncbi:hypothetical protein LEP1GSC048_0411 [Leptospira santarosai serovar Shermani str. 1342KT]|nr:hypothetical protein LEP1GSC048_0411 [Leptospira santarosai serovar Shermani str. 1342KT]
MSSIEFGNSEGIGTKSWEFLHFFFMKKRNLKIRNPRKYVRYHDFVIKSVGTNFKLK